MVLISPEGTRIIGTLEKLSGRGEIDLGSIRANPQGGFTFEYEGTTEVFWDGQETEVWDGERVFLDADGNEFTENTLRLVPEDSITEAAESTPVIVVTMEGGVIHSVDGIPAGVTIRTIDLDVEGVEPERLVTLDDGQPALITEYAAEPTPKPPNHKPGPV
jgi:hypothetical protein